MKKHESNITRRDFLQRSTRAAAGLTLGLGAIGSPVVRPVLGANDKIRVGFVGIGNRGTKLLKSFMSFDDVEVAGLCDVYEPYVDRENSRVDKRIMDEIGGKVPPMNEGLGRRVPRYTDFRDLLDQQDIDAVCIGTPDHWHALQTVMAIDAGKDVYVEKPLTVTVEEGRKMIEKESRSDRIVQVGLNRRGAPMYQKLVEMVRSGKIGQVSVASAFRVSNMYPDGIGNRKPIDAPEGFDWDMWIGPRPYRPYRLNIAPYKFRWWIDYSSQMANWGVHYMDTIRWMLGESSPVAVSVHGSKEILHDDRTIPDTMEVTFEMPSGCAISFGVYEAAGGNNFPYGEIELKGTLGNLYTSTRGYRIVPNGGGQFQDREALIKAESEDYSPPERNDRRYTPTESAANLIENFLGCVKSRNREALMCTLEEGHISTTYALLANIALETGIRIEWDDDREIITNNKFANDLLHYEYREPWKTAWESLT